MSSQQPESSSSSTASRQAGPQIFLDADGVLADFDKAAEKIFGMPPKQAQHQLGMGRFWKRLHDAPQFFASLDLMPDARLLFDAVADRSPVILTGCPLGGWAEPQKRAWAARHFPATPIITCMARDKVRHMQPGDILIDDTLTHRALWEQAGGIFVHHTSALSSLARLRELGVLS